MKTRGKGIYLTAPLRRIVCRRHPHGHSHTQEHEELVDPSTRQNSTEEKVADRDGKRRGEAQRSDRTHAPQKRRRICRESHGGHGCIEFLPKKPSPNIEIIERELPRPN